MATCRASADGGPITSDTHAVMGTVDGRAVTDAGTNAIVANAEAGFPGMSAHRAGWPALRRCPLAA